MGLGFPIQLSFLTRNAALARVPVGVTSNGFIVFDIPENVLVDAKVLSECSGGG